MRVILGVTGCIGAYKSALILRLLQKKGIDVLPVMTRHAREFITPLTLEKLSGNRVISELFENGSTEIEHITVARSGQLLLVAPATANILAKFARGVADDFLSTLYLSTTTPVMVAPAMNVEMWKHPAVQENLGVLKNRGVVVVEPESGYQACGETGPGRLADPERIVGKALELLRAGSSLNGLRVLVTAGPTVEDIDPVRFISNRSSGKMGYALAAEAVRRGATVSLVSGPTHLVPPAGVRLTRIRSAGEMADAVLSQFSEIDVVVKVAAVSDFTIAQPSPQKIKKKDMPAVLELAPTRDILQELGRRKTTQLVVGFAAETANIGDYARQKIREKKLDLIVANPVSGSDSAFASDSNRVTVIDSEDNEEAWPAMAKEEVAGRLWDRIEQLWNRRLAKRTLKKRQKQ